MVSLQFSTLWPEATLYLSFTIKEKYDHVTQLTGTLACMEKKNNKQTQKILFTKLTNLDPMI